MGTTSSISPGVANLLQTLTNVDGPVASSPGLAAALEKAPASDIVRLSVAATQLQNIGSLFSDSSNSNPFTAGTNNNDFTNLESVLTGSSGPTSASAQAAAQLQNVDSLFGIQDSTTANPNDLTGVGNSALEAIANSLTASPPSSTSSTSAQLAQYEALQQIQNSQNLFGTGTNVLG